MIRIVERSYIPAPPERVWQWFSELDQQQYLAWHPEHLSFRTLTGPPLTPGSVIFFDEWIGRFRLFGRWRITEASPGRYFRYDALGRWSLVRAGASFTFVPAGEGCTMIAEAHVGWTLPVLGPLLDRLIPLVLPWSDLHRHIVEEGPNLARLLAENDEPRARAASVPVAPPRHTA